MTEGEIVIGIVISVFLAMVVAFLMSTCRRQRELNDEIINKYNNSLDSVISFQRVELKMISQDILDIKHDVNQIKEKAKEIHEEFHSEEEYSTLNRLHDRVSEILSGERVGFKIVEQERIADKFEGYMQNIDRVNMLVNEFKGCVSMARASLAEKKEPSNNLVTTIELLKVSMILMRKDIEHILSILEDDEEE